MAILLIKSNGYTVNRITDFIKTNDALVLLFGNYANEIGKQLIKMGLKEYNDYLVCI
jgi:hypothetical protein